MIGIVFFCLIYVCIMCIGIDFDNYLLILLVIVKIELVSYVKYFLCVSMFLGLKFNILYIVKVLYLVVYFFFFF